MVEYLTNTPLSDVTSAMSPNSIYRGRHYIMCARSPPASSRKPHKSSFSVSGGKKKVLGTFSSFRRKRPSMLQPATPRTSSRSNPSVEVRLLVCRDDEDFLHMDPFDLSSTPAIRVCTEVYHRLAQTLIHRRPPAWRNSVKLP